MSLKDKLKASVSSGDLLPDLDKSAKYANSVIVEIAGMLRTERVNRKMTQAEFASLCGVSQPMVCQWECGDNNISLKTLAIIAYKLGLKLDISFSYTNHFLDDNAYKTQSTNPQHIDFWGMAA